jgi:hypothetical protein
MLEIQVGEINARREQAREHAIEIVRGEFGWRPQARLGESKGLGHGSSVRRARRSAARCASVIVADAASEA